MTIRDMIAVLEAAERGEMIQCKGRSQRVVGSRTTVGLLSLRLPRQARTDRRLVEHLS